MKNQRKSINKNNVTRYGEFVCTEFAWLPLDRQKENANRLEEITREEE